MKNNLKTMKVDQDTILMLRDLKLSTGNSMKYIVNDLVKKEYSKNIDYINSCKNQDGGSDVL